MSIEMDDATNLFLSESLFTTIPMLHDQLVKPFESLFRGGLSPMQFYTLVYLQRSDSTAMTELASYFCIPKQQMTKIVNRLVELYAVERQSDPKDGRLKRVALTGAGKERLRNYRELLIAHFNETLSKLTPADQQSLLNALNTIRQMIPKINVPPAPPVNTDDTEAKPAHESPTN